MLTVFGYHVSSICIKMILAVFLAILFDPLVVTRCNLSQFLPPPEFSLV